MRDIIIILYLLVFQVAPRFGEMDTVIDRDFSGSKTYDSVKKLKTFRFQYMAKKLHSVLYINNLATNMYLDYFKHISLRFKLFLIGKHILIKLCSVFISLS